MKYNKIPEFNKLYSNNNIKLSYDENEIEPVARILSSLGYLYLAFSLVHQDQPTQRP